MKEPKNFFVRTYGCQMNELDTEVIVGLLESRGLERTEDENLADLLIYNTCSIRDLAERKVMGKLGKLGRSRKKDKMIGVTGCMANAKKDTLFRKLPHIDFVLGTNNIHDLNSVLDEVMATGTQSCRTDEKFSFELDYASAKRDDHLKAFVSIIRGCDKFCTYCVVPYTRGPEVSRSPEHIIEEIKQLADKGYKEVTLLGQNVNSYGKDQPEWNCLFHDLLERIDQETGIARVRFMTSHPVDITRELMEAIRDFDSLCEFVHFPIQSGSSRILRKMHRIYTLEQYMEKVQMLKEIVPNVSLGTDVIVGFPTETEEEFQMTYDAMKEIEYSVAFIFAYSPRKGTPAMRWKDDIPEEVKQERLHRLMELQESIYKKQLQEMMGKEVEVLVERRNSKDDRFVKGRTSCWKKVIFPGTDEMIGTLQKVIVDGYSHQTLIGKMPN
ncbi:(Dimethylallyl)adenosine tRNA methylthiotransferase miaB [Waddlia chondrophila 2032/99]|uniref:tRNA-2-methylthio-N(6)-dimethylallyladenosine synthase n=2 Tax=Waddlia chondrophila TaxID=71667 RepID=D6YWS2_WADCW|nr:tRNA (N6-isopentenyl adenosine(37)-C2)-methylthiotransferase MiaB [Waddlia chondrophila]ADI38583.1 miaB-methiolase [Waddlia chondrophila WSU 86-1044]CCB91714.1 (Dimethylallyl)adenosine tRNA methylthiotransferase miaB [Waddlia chondrophila 2032/99]